MILMQEGLEDWEFWINMLKNGGEVKKIDSVQFFYRKKKYSLTSITKLNNEKLTNYVCEKYASVYNQIIGNHITLINIKNQRILCWKLNFIYS